MWRARHRCLLLDLVLLHTAAHGSKMLPVAAAFEAHSQPTAAAAPLAGTELQLEAQSARVLSRSRQSTRAVSSVRSPVPCKAECGASCPGDLCCSLNGFVRSDGTCKCTAPWHGERCDQLGFRPIRRPQGYGMKPAVSTWGGNILFDGGNFHLYVAAMTNNCSLSSWETNSRIEHAVSQSVTGPYVRADVAVNTWSHNPCTVRLPGNNSSRFALLHIGTGSGRSDGGDNCTNRLLSRRALDMTAGATIHVSQTCHPKRCMIVDSVTGLDMTCLQVADSLDGPWSPLLNSTLGPCNNPSPWVHRNGTIFLVCSGAASGNGLWRAEHIWGPWRLVTTKLVAPGGVFGVCKLPIAAYNYRNEP